MIINTNLQPNEFEKRYSAAIAYPVCWVILRSCAFLATISVCKKSVNAAVHNFAVNFPYFLYNSFISYSHIASGGAVSKYISKGTGQPELINGMSIFLLKILPPFYPLLFIL